MTRAEWDRVCKTEVLRLISLGYDHADAITFANTAITRRCGPRPAAPPPDPTKPSRWGILKIGFTLWRNRNMKFSKAAFVKAILAGLGAAAGAYGIAYGDGVISAAEAVSIGWQFISVLAATLVKPDTTK